MSRPISISTSRSVGQSCFFRSSAAFWFNSMKCVRSSATSEGPKKGMRIRANNSFFISALAVLLLDAMTCLWFAVTAMGQKCLYCDGHAWHSDGLTGDPTGPGWTRITASEVEQKLLPPLGSTGVATTTYSSHCSLLQVAEML